MDYRIVVVCGLFYTVLVTMKAEETHQDPIRLFANEAADIVNQAVASR